MIANVLTDLSVFLLMWATIFAVGFGTYWLGSHLPITTAVFCAGAVVGAVVGRFV